MTRIEFAANYWTGSLPTTGTHRHYLAAPSGLKPETRESLVGNTDIGLCVTTYTTEQTCLAATLRIELSPSALTVRRTALVLSGIDHGLTNTPII